MIKGFRRPPVLLLGVGRQLQIDDRNSTEVHAGCQGTGLILDQFSRAALPHQQGLGLEPLHSLRHRTLHQLGGITAQISGLKGGVGDRWAPVTPLDHREQQIGVGVALRGMEHVMDALHRSGDTHGPNVGGAFVGPEGEFHGWVGERANGTRGTGKSWTGGAETEKPSWTRRAVNGALT